MYSETESSSQCQSSCSDGDYCTTPSEFTADDLDGIEDDTDQNGLAGAVTQEVIISQYVKNVIDVSSHYGNEFSISYTAYNITGRPSKFPDYGDFPETFAMRTYGDWWDKAPSKLCDIMPQTLPEIVSQDYIILQFEELVFPQKISIYETYNPGAVIQIWAYTSTGRWICLWQGKPERAPKTSRLFSPPIKTIPIPTRVIRLDFNHSKLDYFTEIDGVMLIGRKFTEVKMPELLAMSSSARRQHQRNQQQYLSNRNQQHRLLAKGPILRKLESVSFKPVLVQNHQEFLKQFLVNDFENFVIQAGLDQDDISKDSTQLTLNNMPCEILFNIFRFLDLISLFRVSHTCKKLHDVAIDPLLYREVNLSPYWNLVDSNLLNTLSRRCKLIKKLDLSWCGLFDTLVVDNLNEFIKSCGTNLTHLRLNSVNFVDASSMELIGRKCKKLKELCLRNCSSAEVLTNSAMSQITTLERLDLFKASISIEVLFTVLKNNPKLKHLNLGFCTSTTNMDDIAIQISQCNLEIVSIDMWKSHVLSSMGLTALSKCSQLEEVDFGWCLREEASPGLKALVKGCPKLKKLFLASIRGLTDRDLENIANYCKNLEQLDLMGVMGISTDKCFEILDNCKKLKLLDLNFCDHLDDNQIALWRDLNHNVSIKRSPVPTDTFP